MAEEIRSTLKPVYLYCPVLCSGDPGRVHQARRACAPTGSTPSPAHHSTPGTHLLDRFRAFVEVVPLPHHELHSRPCNYSVNAPFVGTPYAVVPVNTRVTAICLPIFRYHVPQVQRNVTPIAAPLRFAARPSMPQPPHRGTNPSASAIVRRASILEYDEPRG